MNAVNLYTYQINGEMFNFGEYLAKAILKKMGFTSILYGNLNLPTEQIESMLLAIGGLINQYYYGGLQGKVSKIDVWGSGFDCLYNENNLLSDEILKEKFNFKMIRGKLTRKVYHLPKNILLGDIGFLASYLFDVPMKQDKKIVQIPFYFDTGVSVIPGVTKVISTLIKKDSQGLFESNFQEVLNDIASAEFVLTGSMHAAIVAHSFNVPWAMCHKANTDISKEWKWWDTFSTLGLEPDDFKICYSLEEAHQWWKIIRKKIRLITKEYQNQILEVFPYGHS